MPSIIVNNHVNSLQITFWKILDPIINCFTTQIFTSGHEWNHNQNGNHFVSQHKYLSPSLQRTFLLKFSLFFFLKKIKMSQRVFERKQQREIFFYIFSWVISGSFWQFQLPETAPPKSLICWIKLGEPDLGTHPTPTSPTCTRWANTTDQ